MVYHGIALHNYFIPSHCDIRAAHDGRVGCNIVEYTVFLYFDWLSFLWHGIKDDIH